MKMRSLASFTKLSFVLVVAGLMLGAPRLLAREEIRLSVNADVDELGDSLKRLFTIMKERLELMEQVAAHKWNTKEPIEDLAREKQVVDKIVADAAKYQLDKDFLTTFVQAQMYAAKQMQRKYFDQWTTSGVHGFDNTPDLTKEIRPRLDRMREPLLVELAKVKALAKQNDVSELIDVAAKNILTTSFIDESIIRVAIAPLLADEAKADDQQCDLPAAVKTPPVAEVAVKAKAN